MPELSTGHRTLSCHNRPQSLGFVSQGRKGKVFRAVTSTETVPQAETASPRDCTLNVLQRRFPPMLFIKVYSCYCEMADFHSHSERKRASHVPAGAKIPKT